MKFILLFLFLISPASNAIEAVVTVLQAPVFSKASLKSQVIDYIAKGTKIHLNQLDVDQSDLVNLKDDLREEIPYIKKLSSSKSKFYQIYNRNGKESYILKKHLFVYNETTDELNAKLIPKDGTDYRLHEPLPPAYPFNSPHSKRAWGALGFGNLQRDEYNFQQNNLQTYGSRADMTFTYAEKSSLPKNDRLYFGAMTNFHYTSRSYSFSDRNASEKSMVFGVGPYLSFDPWRGEKTRFSIYTSVLVDLISLTNITQEDNTKSENATFRSFNLRPKIGAFYSWSQVFIDLDPIIGLDLQTTKSLYSSSANSDSSDSSWWRSSKLDQKMGLEFTVFFGIQKRI